MAEVKNSFISSKMNKDLDDRLIPNNQYRDALNIEIGKSETNNIGVLQNVYGNVKITPETNPNLECIGTFMDNQNNRIFQFLTDYIDPFPNNITYPTSGTMKIVMLDLNANPATYTVLVEGLFLNFAKNRQFRITGVNLVETLLFWTDNRNQPRKINVSNAINTTNYYTTEDQISVAKYAPVDPITMYKKETATVVSGAGDTWVLSNMSSLACTIGAVSGGPPAPYTATITTAITNGFANFSIGDVIGGTNGTGSFGLGQIIITSINSPTSIQVSSTIVFTAGTVSITLRYPYLGAIQPGATVLSNSSSGVQFLDGSDYATVVSMSNTTLTLYQPTTDINNNYILTFLISTMTDKSDVPTWPGDPSFLEDKYVRFSYRFKYDDNEYSLMAPFTQIAYIPKQKGYFIAGNETDAYRSTILNWFENNVNNIELIVPFPDKVGNLNNSYKIQEVDILYKESDSNAIKVFETVPISAINTPINTNNNYYVQPYQSQKPYKTLSEAQTVRVYDKVPVRAKAQEVAGNRVIYGNYYDKYTSVSSINYNTSVQPKSPNGTNFIEYPNHTLKKNRNYQVGFVIADKFGRQSSVILSTVDVASTNIGGGQFAKGSTVYSGYEDTLLFQDVRSWFGDALILYLNSPIDQPRSISSGTPGLYAIPTSPSGFAITSSTITDTTYTFTLDPPAPGGAANIIPLVGNILRGFYTDYVTVTNVSPTPIAPYSGSYTVTTSGRVNDGYAHVTLAGGARDIKFSYEYNPIGWYSYKVVVKQQEQDYYNVYLPGMLNGYPKNQTSGSQVVYTGSGASATSTLQNGINTTQFPVSETGNTSHIVLINDNINKVPRDLSEVGPDQKQYRSSVQLYGRVENTKATIDIIGNVPLYSSQTRTIQYSTTAAGQGLFALIKAGDGIQCEEASEPVPDNTPPATGNATKPNPYKWPGDTVVVSNVIVGTTGTITLSSPCWVLKAAQNPILAPNPGSGDYISFVITRAENKQYFPTRKADTVIAIASATEFNFLSSSADNLSGTAGLNFYQLQNQPLIGRVSTVNKIGVIATEMIPFLSVYETRPDQSLLELFWETATTGLISDLNADVLTGFEGPSSFGEVNYLQFEHQDPNGTDSSFNNQGTANSKYVTGQFYVLDQNGFLLSNTTVTLLSVIDGNGNSRLADFGVETLVGPTSLYRLFIKNPFVFNNNANSAETYSFVFNVVDVANPTTATQLTINGRLGNNNPIITPVSLFYNITQDTTSIVTLGANNGAFYDLTPPPPPPVILPVAPSTTGLKWTIATPVPSPYFSITTYGGTLSLTDPNVPIGIYTLEIKVQDAVNTSTGAILNPENTDFGTLSDTIILTINVGDDPVPYWLRPTYESLFLTNPLPCGFVVPNNPQYGIAYIGPVPNPGVGDLPVIPGSGSVYNWIDNVEVDNAAAYGVSPIIPEGLTQGEYRFEITLQVPPPPAICPGLDFATITGEGEIYLYKRIYTPSGTNLWVLSANENNWGQPPSSYPIGPLVASTTYDASTGITTFGPTQILTTSFTIEADASISPAIYEYAVGIKFTQNIVNSDMANPFMRISGNDANYAYSVPPAIPVQPFFPPITNAYAYYTGVEESSLIPPGQTSGVPRDTQDAMLGVSYSSPINAVSSGTIATGDLSVQIGLATANGQVAPGLYYTFTLLSIGTFVGRVIAINVGGNPNIIALELNAPFSGTPGSLIGGNISFTTVGLNLTTGVLYANTEEGTEVKRFYTDSAFTQKWIPPVPNKFYNFVTSKNYNPGAVTFGPSGSLRYTEYPYYSALFNADGEVIDQTIPTPNVQTAWIGQDNSNASNIPDANYSYNLYYESIP